GRAAPSSRYSGHRTKEKPMRPTSKLLIVLVIFSVVASIHAERPIEDKKAASDVVTGTVQKITAKEQKYENDGIRTSYVAEIKIDQVERGKNTKPGEVISVTWFHVTKTPSKPVPDAYGHKYDVQEKTAVRAYLIREKKVFSIIYNPAGIEKLKTTNG